LALTATTHSENGVPSSGFTLKIGLIDFFMIQRGLMLLPDEHAKETLGSVRQQILAQTKTEPDTRPPPPDAVKQAVAGPWVFFQGLPHNPVVVPDSPQFSSREECMNARKAPAEVFSQGYWCMPKP
jgi:hypothetical protein